MKSKFAKRLAALLLTLVMSLGLLVPGAFADDFNAATEIGGNGTDGKIVVTVYDRDPSTVGTGAPVSDSTSPVDGVGINTLRIGSVVELTSTAANGTVSTQVAFGLENDIMALLGLQADAAIAENAGTCYFEPTVVQQALSTKNSADGGQAEVEGYLNDNKDKKTQKTDVQGAATFMDLKYGLYLLAKSELPANATTDLVPFLVSVPMYVENKDNGGEWQTTVYAHPKVRTATMSVTKEVDDQDKYVNAGQTLKYTVTVDIPEVEKGNGAPTEFTEFSITDTNANQTLDLDSSSLKLQVQSGNTEPVNLNGVDQTTFDGMASEQKKDYDYYYTYPSPTSPGSNESVFTITFTDTGLETLNDNLVAIDATTGQDDRLPQKVIVTYNSIVATDGSFSKTLTNTAKATYKREGMKNAADTANSAVTLYTYGIDLTKTLSDGEEISTIDGNKITFTLYRTYNGNTLDHAVPVKLVNGNYWVAADAGASGTNTYAMDVNGNGELTLYGLEPGDYYLKETATMTGYSLLDEPIKIVITASEDNDGNVTETATVNDAAAQVTNGVVSLSVENTELTAGFALPQTGGAGTLAVTAIGLGLLCVAIVLLVVYRKKGNKNS